MDHKRSKAGEGFRGDSYPDTHFPYLSEIDFHPNRASSSRPGKLNVQKLRRSRSSIGDLKRRRSSLEDIENLDPDPQPFVQPSMLRNTGGSKSVDTPQKANQKPEKPPRSIMRTTGKRRQMDKKCISFSPHDQVLVCPSYYEEEISLVAAQQGWKIYKRPSLAVRGAVEDAKRKRKKEQAMHDASAYSFVSQPSVFSTPLSSGNSFETDNNIADELKVSSSMSSIGRSIGTQNVGQEPTSAASSGTLTSQQGEKTTTSKPRRMSKSKGHHHWHGYNDCEHGYNDPMDCRCTKPEKKILEDQRCKECAEMAMLAEMDDDQVRRRAAANRLRRETKEATNSGWLKKLGLGRKIYSS